MTHSDAGSMPYHEGMIVFIVLTVLSLPLPAALAYFIAAGPFSRKQSDPTWMSSKQLGPFFNSGPGHLLRRRDGDVLCLGVGCALILCGLATLAAWCGQAEIVQAFAYRGPIHLTNYTISGPRYDNAKYTYQYNCRTVSYSCQKDGKSSTCHRQECETGFYESMSGTLLFDFGGPSICPHTPTKTCSSHNRADACDFKVCGSHGAKREGGPCTDEQRSEAFERVGECLFRRYNGGEKIRYDPFDLSGGEGGGGGNSYVRMYADCEACETMFDVPAEEAERNRVAGFIVLWCGLSFWWAFVIRNGLLGLLFGWDGDLPQSPFRKCTGQRPTNNHVQMNGDFREQEITVRGGGANV